MIFALLAAAFFISFVYLIKTTIKPKGYPPGPKWLPVIGSSNVVQHMTQKHGSQFGGFLALAKEYSTQVLGLNLSGELLVVVFGEKNVRQSFVDKAFEGRPNSFFLKLRCLGKKMGISFSDGPLWQIHRQHTVKQLKNVGFGKTLMEKAIQNELSNILEYIEENRHKPINPNHIFSMSVMNVLWKYAAGENIEKEKLNHLLELFSIRSKAFNMAGGLLNQMPWCRFILPEISGYNLILNINKQLSDIIEEAIVRHKNKEVASPDFIYSYLEESSRNKEVFSEEQLKVICMDLFIAGAQTTGNCLKFALLRLLREKKMQELIYDEIKTNIGDKTPCWNDTNALIYTSAFLLEIYRYYPIAPLAGPRRLLEDVTMDGYVIPKDTTVLISIGDINFDPELWVDPHEFKPERFIDESGQLKYSEHMYPFGMGRRRCPGDSLARSFIFITFVGIVQKYCIDIANGIMPSDELVIGLISAPKPFSVEFIPRN